MIRLPHVFAWQVRENCFHAESRDAAAPIAVNVERYESEGRIVLYRPLKDTATLAWNAERVN